MDTEQSVPRTRDDMEWEIRSAICLLSRYRNLARNADLALTLVTLIGLSSAAGSIFNASPILASTAGVLLTMTSILQIVYKPAEAKVHAAVSRKMYTDLWSQMRRLTDEELDDKLIKLHGEDIGLIEGLRLVAEIDTSLQLNLDDSDQVKRLTGWNKFLRFCS
ncbi:hypothetical protein HME01_22780 [Vreelandella aquamarina]|jgi:hypothetical protein|uniref:SMODS and SLOG-associating 2TM effector domain-containing protein n=1 Tax=Vreelandella aquamarina TaxID=77097 RepID=A0A1N6IQ31_9GAMM|nr:hypothetical protein [Halomonas meridiana]GED46426.1 hypothetical protein HME01_22780 [Halomonas meridiana]SIN66498.1 hypothetical protein SAMN05878249_2148 [Halomonas meridiana]SIN79419.1 hypothetical protein SAMN05878438_3584 [Halomonas meridiana]SIO34147.1 hypothetical protein SAMN05878442_2459 [Halomonas meridiana]